MNSVLSFSDVSVRYAKRTVLDGVTLSCMPGRVIGIVGPNGAGKTTLLRAALGLVAVAGGDVSVGGRPLRTWDRFSLARTVAYLPQGADAHWPVTARHLVALGRIPHCGEFGGYRPEDERAIDAALARCDAVAFSERRMDELSAGERARVMLARALATDAAVLLADEPAAYLDPSHQLGLMELLSEEAKRGVAVIVTLHDLALASRHCDEIVVLDDGRIAARGPVDIALADEVLSRVFAIEAVRAAGAAGRPAIVAWKRI